MEVSTSGGLHRHPVTSSLSPPGPRERVCPEHIILGIKFTFLKLLSCEHYNKRRTQIEDREKVAIASFHVDEYMFAFTISNFNGFFSSSLNLVTFPNRNAIIYHFLFRLIAPGDCTMKMYLFLL